MNKKIKTAYLVSLSVSIVLALFAIILRSFLLLSQYDEAIGHFLYSSYLDDAFAILLLVSAVFLFITSIFMRGSEGIRVEFSDLPTLFSSAFLSIALFVFGIFILIDAGIMGKSGFSLFFSAAASLFAFLSIPYYILRLASASIKKDILTLFSFAPVIFGCALAFLSYFDSSAYMNSPTIVLNQISGIMIALFSLGESRVLLSRIKWPLYTAVGLTAFIVTVSDALPSLVFIPFSENASYGKIIISFTIFAFSLYIIARLFSIYALNSRDAKSLISFFKEVFKKNEEGDEPAPEQISMDLSGKEEETESEGE
jgi:hypothetical protein